MDREIAINIAQKHIDSLNENNPNSDIMIWTLSSPKKLANGFLFEYTFDLKAEDNQVAFGGAPGFSVIDDKVKELSWEEFNNLQPDN